MVKANFQYFLLLFSKAWFPSEQISSSSITFRACFFLHNIWEAATRIKLMNKIYKAEYYLTSRFDWSRGFGRFWKHIFPSLNSPAAFCGGWSFIITFSRSIKEILIRMLEKNEKKESAEIYNLKLYERCLPSPMLCLRNLFKIENPGPFAHTPDITIYNFWKGISLPIIIVFLHLSFPVVVETRSEERQQNVRQEVN